MGKWVVSWCNGWCWSIRCWLSTRTLVGKSFSLGTECYSVLTCVLRVVTVESIAVEVVVAITVEAVVVLWVDACWVWVLLL